MRRTRKRATLTTGVGLLVMVAGAMLAFAPTAQAQEDNPWIVNGRVQICHRTSAETHPYVTNMPSADSLNGGGKNDHTQHTGGPAGFEVFTDPADYAPPFKDSYWGDIIPPFDGVGLNWTDEGQTIWENGCRLPQEPESESTLTLEKVVDGNNAAAQGDWSFDFDFDDVTLTKAVPKSDPSLVDPGVEYTINELDAKGAATTITCDGDSDDRTFSQNGLELKVTVAADAAVTCTFTNSYNTTVRQSCLDLGNCPTDPTPPAVEADEPATLTVTKAVLNADGTPADGPWSYGFTSDPLGAFTLSDGNASLESNDLDAGAYTVTENAVDDGSTLTGIDCGDHAASVNLATRTVSVSLAEGDVVSCTFVNTLAEVLGEEEVRTPEAGPVVLGETATRTLPRTGAGTGGLTLFGLALLALGFGLVRSGRRLSTTA